ncbi:MAG: TolC family protein [Candidatus Cryptobacteroides sp.]
MKKRLIIFALMLCPFLSYSQDGIKEALQSIENNNLQLKALREELKGQELEAELSAALGDPEIEAAYLWGSPSSIGSRKDLSISQSLDFATLSGTKKRLSDSRKELAGYDYACRRMEILLDAHSILLQLSYYNALLESYDKRIEELSLMEKFLAQKYEAGALNRLEYNNILLKTAALRSERTRHESSKKELEGRLCSLNGGQPMEWKKKDFDPVLVEKPSEELASPYLQRSRAGSAASERELALSKEANLPSLNMGYMGEFVAGENFQGISLGLSIPLWSNSRRVQQAQAQLQAARYREEESRQSYSSYINALYSRIETYALMCQEYALLLEKADNRPYLQKALEQGAISVLDYLVELDLYYQALESYLDAELDYNLLCAEYLASEL